jgi:opacity protein-like surface antigen
VHAFRSGLMKTVVLATVCASWAAMAAAQSDSSGVPTYRAEKWDVSLGLIYALETDISGEGGSQATINDDLGFGFAGGYNFNSHFQLGGSFNWDSRSYDATGIGNDGSRLQYNNNLESTALGLNGIYFILPGNITPFVSGTLGYTFVDSNIQNGPTETVYYYDPWWGYTYDTYTPTRSESGLSYGAGIGLRVDFNENFGLQLSYNKTWVDINNTAETPDFDTIRLDFIGRTF